MIATPYFENKICSENELDARLMSLPRPHVLTNGVFDLLHRGHAYYLAHAKALGRSLFVAVNSDASVRLLNKSPQRPINTVEDRMALLAALASVDIVTPFHEQTPMRLLQKLRPEIYVKGGDYDIEKLEETHWVRSWGGQAVAIPIIHAHSTTKLIKTICASWKMS